MKKPGDDKAPPIKASSAGCLWTLIKIIIAIVVTAVCVGLMLDQAGLAKKAPDSQRIIVNVPPLVGKKEKEIEALLGKPDRCETNKLSGWGKTKGCFYRGGNDSPGGIEIAFINGAANWIFVHKLEELAYEPRSVEALGITGLGTPEISSIIEWKKQVGYRQVVLFHDLGSDRVSYFFLSNIKPPKEKD